MSAVLKLQQQPQAKPLPTDIEAEQSVLGGLMLENRTFYAVSALVGEDDFFRHDHRLIWRALATLAKAGSPMDFVTLSGHLRDRGELDDVGGLAYLGTLANDTPSAANVEAYAERVREMSRRRRVLAYAWELAAAAYDTPADEMVGSIGTSAGKLLATQSAPSRKFGDAVADAEQSIQRARAARESGGTVGAPTGLPALDRLIGGFSGPRLIVVAARPKCGKSALVNQFAVHAAPRGYPGLIVSLELGADELAIRAMATASGVSVTKLHRGYVAELDTAADVVARMGDVPLWFDCETTRLDAIAAQIALHRQRHGIKWAVVDHIGLIRTTKSYASDNDRLGEISWTLKELSRRLGIPVIALSQLSRKCDSEGRRPRPDDLRGSGNIEQDADMVIMLHTPLAARGEPVRPVQIGVPANRIGPSLWLDTAFEFVGSTQTFRQVVQQHDADE